MVDRDALRHAPVPYLGWYLEGEPGPLGSGTYRWHANEDNGPGKFRLLVDVSKLVPDHAKRYEEARELGLSICKAKVFLASWSQDSEDTITLPVTGDLPPKELRELLLRGLYRLYERGFGDGDFQVELDGIVFLVGVSRTLVDRAVEYLLDEGLIHEFGTAGRNRMTGDIWLTSVGARQVEELIEEKTAVLYPTRTFLFTDVVGSTRTIEKLGDEAAHRLMREYDDLIRDSIRAHGGEEVKGTGDGVMAAFVSASAAVRAAIGVQRSIHAKSRTRGGLAVRIGLNSGDAVEDGKDYYGRAVNLAARLCAAAKGGGILVSRVVRDLAAGALVEFSEQAAVEAKGFDEPVPTFAVTWREAQPGHAPFRAGDRVQHPKFGQGIVISISPTGKDHQVVVAFQGEAGIKKLLLSFAPLEKIEA